MVAGKLIIIPALGHQNKGKSSFTGSALFVLLSQCGNNYKLARHHVPCDRLLQKAYSSSFQTASLNCRGIILLLLLSHAAFATNSRTLALKYSNTAADMFTGAPTQARSA